MVIRLVGLLALLYYAQYWLSQVLKVANNIVMGYHPNNVWAGYIHYNVAPLVGTVLALYLFFSGAWIINRILRGLGRGCPGCGYDTSGVRGSVCPECGVDLYTE